MEAQGPATDRLSNLPPNIIETMLTLMPIRDAFRTSILSHSWKDHYLNMPVLKFDDEMFQGSAYQALSVRYKLLHVIYPILLLHKGPIVKFSLCISQLNSCWEIDRLILHLSSNATVKEFTLTIGIGDDHKLLPPFFMLQQLESLSLRNCAFQPPASFKGFSKLMCLQFNNVSITVDELLLFISNCPLLILVMKNILRDIGIVTLSCYQAGFTIPGLSSDHKINYHAWMEGAFNTIEAVVVVDAGPFGPSLDSMLEKSLTPQQLPVSLVYLKHLVLFDLCFANENELRFALLFLTSSPNIETIVIQMRHNPTSQTGMNIFDLQDRSHVILDRLREITIRNFINMEPVMDFLKLILAKSPVLKLVDIVTDKRVSPNLGSDLRWCNRASDGAKINFVHPAFKILDMVYDDCIVKCLKVA
ncbi:hypothetical protein QVD17_20891 [Tagetes erecta]|uniref:At1g61320/AtMIF1 LRR domain-containing protein n=1 Tax=Tagetes erecta TaxID=13708 RepID=A0AAD8NXM4_TARER|nr:hypothetical protein QVD17_20891 [Tagetes erecta]